MAIHKRKNTFDALLELYSKIYGVFKHLITKILKFSKRFIYSESINILNEKEGLVQKQSLSVKKQKTAVVLLVMECFEMIRLDLKIKLLKVWSNKTFLKFN